MNDFVYVDREVLIAEIADAMRELSADDLQSEYERWAGLSTRLRADELYDEDRQEQQNLAVEWRLAHV